MNTVLLLTVKFTGFIAEILVQKRKYMDLTLTDNLHGNCLLRKSRKHA